MPRAVIGRRRGAGKKMRARNAGAQVWGEVQKKVTAVARKEQWALLNRA